MRRVMMIVEMKNRIEPQGHKKRKERKRKERKGFQMSRPKDMHIQGTLVPLELDLSTMAIREGGSVDLRWYSKTD